MDDDNWLDEFEVEVTDLRTGQRSRVRQRDDSGQILPSQTTLRATPIDDGLAPEPVEPRPPSRGQRRRARVVACAASLLALSLLLLPNSPLALTGRRVSTTPKATAIIQAGDTELYMVHAAPWGKLRVDGKVENAIQNGSSYSSISVSPGTHTIDYVAPPFPTVRCTVTLPRDSGSDTCPADQNTSDSVTLPSPDAAVVNLGATVSNLSSYELGALTSKIESTLPSLGGRALLQPGDHYLDAEGNTQSTSRNMLAIVSYSVAANAQLVPGCSKICDVPGMDNSSTGSAWDVEVGLVENWRYLIANGPEVPGPQISQYGAPLAQTYSVTWNGGWNVQGPAGPGNLDCESGNSTLVQDISSVNSTFFQSSFSQTESASQSNPADGCAIALFSVSSSGAPTSPTAYFLYRSGVVVAVNNEALSLSPSMPSPSAHELQIAQSLIATITAH